MKKVCSIILTLLFVLAAVPCHASEADTEAAPSSTATPEAVEITLPEETPGQEEISVPEESPALVESPEQEAPAPVESPEQEAPAPVESSEQEAPAPVESPEQEDPAPVEPSEQEEPPAPENAALPMPAAEVPVRVYVQRTGRIIINPYNLEYELSDGYTRDQIVGESFYVGNGSAVPVNISASAVGTVTEGSTLRYAANKPASRGEKEIFLYAEFKDAEGTWQNKYTNAANQVLVSSTASTAKRVLTLDVEGEGMFRMFGAASKGPDDPWTSDDGVSVSIIFTFAAAEEPAAMNAIMEAPVEEAAAEEESPVEEEPPAENEIPVETPEEPSEEPVTPEEPETPEAPSETPEKPAETPEEAPSETPEEPVTPDVPEETPATPEETGTPEEEVTPEADGGAEDAES